MKAIDIISPVFREEATIAAFHQTLTTVVETLSDRYAFRFIYVLDPAGDGTEEALARIAAEDDRVTVIVMSRRFGHQAALVAGIDESHGDAVIMLDSDLQHPPHLIVEMLKRWENGADIVQTLRRDGLEIARSKRTTSRWFYKLLAGISNVQLQSGAADYRLLARKVADVFRNDIREHNPFLRGLVSWVGFTVSYLPFEPEKRRGGVSNYSLATLLSFAVNGFCSFSKLPLRLSIIGGLMISFMSLLGGAIYILFYLLDTESAVPGWASLFVLMSVAIGLNMLFLGILGEYVGLIFDEVKSRPRYIVHRTHGPRNAPQMSLETSLPLDRRDRTPDEVEFSGVSKS